MGSRIKLGLCTTFFFLCIWDYGGTTSSSYFQNQTVPSSKFQVLEISSAHGRRTQLDPKEYPIREQAELIECIHSERIRP